MIAEQLIGPDIAFDEPWQAEAFATAVQLSRSGVFTWSEWVAQFSTTIAREPQRDGESIGDAYYRQWMTALEALLATSLCLSGQTVTARQAAWHAAYLSTPHGQPVALSNAVQTDDDHEHDGHHHHAHHHHHSHDGAMMRPVPRPAAVVPARR